MKVRFINRIMPHHGQLSSDEEIKGAGSEGLKGAVHGACMVRFLSACHDSFRYFILLKEELEKGKRTAQFANCD